MEPNNNNERERRSNAEQAGLSDTISLSNMRPDSQHPFQSTPAMDPMMGVGAYGPLSGLDDVSTVMGSLPLGRLDSDPNIFNQLSLLLENLPHSNAFNLQRGYVPTSEIQPQVIVPTPSSPIRNQPAIPDDLESVGSSNEAVELNERSIEEQLINPQTYDVISQQDAGRSDYQHVDPQPFDVRPRQDVRRIEAQQIPPQSFDVRTQQDERRNRPNKSQPRNARPHNAGSMSKMNTQQPDARPRYPNVFEAFGGKMKYQEELNKIHPSRQREGEQPEQTHTYRNPKHTQQKEGRSLETEVPRYNQVSNSNTQQRHNQTDERFSGTRIPIPTRQCEERSKPTTVPHHNLQSREGQSFARKNPTYPEGESFARRTARSNLEGPSFERRTPRSIQHQYEERSYPQPYPTRTQQNEGWSMETEIPHYNQNYQDDRFSQQPRQPNTQSYEGRSMKTYVPHQETDPHTNTYQTDQRIEDIHRLLTERLREMEYKYQSLEQTVLNMQIQNSRSGDSDERAKRNERPRQEDQGSERRYTRNRQGAPGRGNNRERRTADIRPPRRRLSDNEDYDHNGLEDDIERQNARQNQRYENNNERRRNVHERRQRRQTSDNEESDYDQDRYNRYVPARDDTPPATDDVNRRGGYQRNGSNVVMPKLPVYDGVSSTWDSFKNMFEMRANALGWNEQYRFQNMCLCLTGKAVDYYVKIRDQGKCRTYRDFQRQMDLRFNRREDPATIRLQFSHLKQGVDEPLEDWSERVMTKANEAFHGIDPAFIEQEMIMRFCSGSTDKEAAQFVMNCSPTSLEDAMKRFKRYKENSLTIYGGSRRVRAIQRSNFRSRSPSPSRNNTQNVASSMSPRQNYVKKDDSQKTHGNQKGDDVVELLQQLLQQLKGKSNFRSPATSPRRKGACFICQSTEHFAAECPKKGTCFICSSKDHYAADCPSRTPGACYFCGESDHKMSTCKKLAPEKGIRLQTGKYEPGDWTVASRF